MPDQSYSSVIDRIGAFNAATEALAKRRAPAATFIIESKPGWKLSLVATDENYSVELTAPGLDAETAGRLAPGYSARGDVFSRPVRKPERSWEVADSVEDLLTEALGLPPDVALTRV